MTALRRSFGAALAAVAVLFGLSIVAPGPGARAAVPVTGRAAGIAAAGPAAPAIAARSDDERASAAAARVRNRAVDACAAAALLVVAALWHRRGLGSAGAPPSPGRARIAARGPPALALS
jgi:hypothetical protein